jgi:hypothetical protein
MTLPILKLAFTCAAACALAGCSSGESSLESSPLTRTVGGIGDAFSTSTITLDQVAEIPFASIGYSVGGNNETMLVLSAENGGQLIWTSSAKIFLVTHRGRIVRTIGLDHDLRELVLENGAHTALFDAALGKDAKTVWRARFSDPDELSAEMSCVAHGMGAEPVTILGRMRDAIRVEESCVSPNLRWRFTNTYWVDTVGAQVLRSVQHVHPRLQAVTTEILRPSATD